MRLFEFAPDPPEPTGDPEYNKLRDLAASWYEDNESKYADVLRSLGWKIEYGDDYNLVILWNVNGKDYIGFTAGDLGQWLDESKRK